MKKAQKILDDDDLVRLLALKAYERPDADRAERNIQNIMREVRNTDNTPSSVLLFPEKKFAWMLEHPQYGFAALFLLFLALHIINRPVVPGEQTTQPVVFDRVQTSVEAVAATIETPTVTNQMITGIRTNATGIHAGMRPVMTSFTDK